MAPLFKDIFTYLGMSGNNKTILSCSSQFYTQLMNLINRLAVLKRTYFLECANSLTVQPGQLLDAWFSKMEYLLSHESKRLNLIAIYALFPTFPEDFIQKNFLEIARQTFSALDHFNYLKLQNDESRFFSPSKLLEGGKKKMPGDGSFKKNQVIAVSTRVEELKKSDSMHSIDLVDHFKASMLEFMGVHG